jgi:amidase
MGDDTARLDATALAAAIRAGELSPAEAVEAAIRRIESLDPRINAVIHRRFERALAEAADPTLPDGPFRGVPFLLKDLWPTSAGDPLHMGVRALAEAGYRHPSDSNIVTAYRRAGFVILGRTNTPELGLVATTEPLVYGPTRNPWDTDRGVGGSSGGSAAAVAAGMVPAANASDGGGSIRIPAAMCGLVGLKPSRGRVSMGPMQDEWGLSVQHVVCHTVRDCAGILDVSDHPFPGDGVIAPKPVGSWSEVVGRDPGRLRVGLCARSPSVETHPDCEAAAREAARLLESLGHEVHEAWPAVLERSAELGATFTKVWAASARAALVTVGRLIGRELGEGDVEPGTWALAAMGEGVRAADLIVAQADLAAVRRELAWWWADGFDLLVTPTTAAPQPRIGELVPTPDDPTRGLFGSLPYATFTSLFNTSGQPAISLPLGRGGDGLPLGVQLVAAYGREDLLLAVAAQLEAEVRWAERRAPLHP